MNVKRPHDITCWKKSLAAFALCLSMGIAARAQDAPSQFWAKRQIAAQSANFAVRTYDVISTCRDLGRGWKELSEPTQSCDGVTAWTMSAVPASIGMSYLLHRRGHDKMARWIPWLFTAGDVVAVGYSASQHQYACTFNHPCEAK